jgi:hypothetical protein
MSELTYVADTENPGTDIIWKDWSGTLIDFSTGFTFTVKLTQDGVTALTKSTNIVGSATEPNIRISWDADELDLTPGVYQMWVYANDGVDRDRVFRPNDPPLIRIVAAPIDPEPPEVPT